MPQSRFMNLLHTLRNTPWMAKLALLWFALTLGVAVASPMVNPQEELVICSSSGMVKVTVHADGSISTESSAALSCPLCVLGNAAPLAFGRVQPAQVHVLTYAHPEKAAEFIAASTAAPPPSRGPPRSIQLSYS